MASVDDLPLVIGLGLLAIVVLIAFGAMLGKWIRRKTLANLHPDSRWDGTSKDLVLDYPAQAAKYASLPLVLLGVVDLAFAVFGIASPEMSGRLGWIIGYAAMAAFCWIAAFWKVFIQRRPEFILNSTGVGRTAPKRQSFFVRWDEIRELRISPLVPNYLSLVTAGGRYKIPLFLNGRADLASLIAVKVPQSKWGKGVESVIESSVKGAY
jgi:hypothetical protein